MAALLLKNNSTQGIYITADNAGKIAANTPGDLDLDGLTLGTNYIYFDIVLRFEEKATFNREEPDFLGWKTWSSGTTTVQATTGSAYKNFFLISVEVDETTAEYMKTLAKWNVRRADEQMFLIKQTASEAFEQFPNSAVALKKFCKIIIRGIAIVEMTNSAGKDVKVINLACEQIDARN